jgi:hypothetical protein
MLANMLITNKNILPYFLTLKRSGYKGAALNAKLDFGDETEEWHGLTASATYEKAL